MAGTQNIISSIESKLPSGISDALSSTIQKDKSIIQSQDPGSISSLPKLSNLPTNLFSQAWNSSLIIDPRGMNQSEVILATSELLLTVANDPTNIKLLGVCVISLSLLAAFGWLGGPDGNNLSNALLNLDISNGTRTGSIVEGITILSMQEMQYAGLSATESRDVMYVLFPEDNPVCNQIRTTSDKYAEKDPAPVSQQSDLESEWATTILNPTTQNNINAFNTDLRTSYIESFSYNVFLAMIEAICFVLDDQTVRLNALSNSLNLLSEGSSLLSTIIQEWSSGYPAESPTDAQNFMAQLQQLQDIMDTPGLFPSGTQSTINSDFDTIYSQPALYQGYQGYETLTDQPCLSDGQAVVPGTDDPIYYDDNSNNQAFVYENPPNSNDWYYYPSGSSVSGTPNNSNLEPAYWTPGSTGTDSSNLTTTANPSSNIQEIPCSYYMYNTNDNSTQFFVSTTGEVPPGDTVETNQYGEYYVDSAGNTVYLAPPAGTYQVTIQTEYDRGNYSGLQSTFEQYQPQPVDPNNPNSGGVPTEWTTINQSLLSLQSALSGQSSLVTSDINQITSVMKMLIAMGGKTNQSQNQLEQNVTKNMGN